MTSQNDFRNICIVGNIASGKSTLTQLLAQEIPDSIAVLESFERNPFLALYFQDPPRWAFTNAVRYFYDYVRVFTEQTASHAHKHHFIDAGAATNRYVYGRHMFQKGLVTPEEYAFYDILCDLIERALEYPQPDAFIFIQASPQACYERMRARAWGYQREIPLEYLDGLRGYFDAYQAMLKAAHVPLLQLDGDAITFTTPEGRACALQAVRAFLGET
ncbi:MAG: deoxynucleoside kinase [Chloroflexi bacterium]|nr:deoxynucleoside kinase [Chloroflexota bacterium]